MNQEIHYHVILHSTGKESGPGFKGFDECYAYFFTAAPVGSEEFKQERQKAIDTFSGQQLKHGWTGYKVGKTEAEVGREKVDCLSPSYGYAQRPKARLVALRYGLKLEILGMKKKGCSAYSILKKEYGYKGSRKDVLSQLEK